MTAFDNGGGPKKTEAEAHTRAPRRGTSAAQLVSEYQFDARMSRAQRLAHFLDWMAKKAPYVTVPPNLVLKAIMGYQRTPRPGTEEVESLMNAVGSAREILMRQHHRGLHVVRGVGMRATVDDQDTADTQQRTNVRRLLSAHRKVKETAEIIDPSKIRDDKIRAWVKGGVATALRSLDADGRLDRLLPPPKEPKG